MAKLADALDLGSSGQPYGFKSLQLHQTPRFCSVFFIFEGALCFQHHALRVNPYLWLALVPLCKHNLSLLRSLRSPTISISHTSACHLMCDCAVDIAICQGAKHLNLLYCKARQMCVDKSLQLHQNPPSRWIFFVFIFSLFRFVFTTLVFCVKLCLINKFWCL